MFSEVTIHDNIVLKTREEESGTNICIWCCNVWEQENNYMLRNKKGCISVISSSQNPWNVLEIMLRSRYKRSKKGHAIKTILQAQVLDL